jgi:Type VI secretion system/phage-baseplate injector OB domain
MTENAAQKYFGKYRGMVVSNLDPLQIGRLLVQVPDVLGPIPSSWAMPCLPFTGKQMGMWCLPQVGTGVWVEFEQGNPDYPIWSGCWYGLVAEVPALALAAPPAVPNVVIQTAAQNTLMLSDLPEPTGGILLKTTTGAFISVNDIGITISNGKGAIITMTGPTVDINMTALTVT